MEDFHLNNLIDDYLDLNEELAEFMELEETDEGPKPQDDLAEIDLAQLKFHFERIHHRVTEIVTAINMIEAHSNKITQQAPTRPQG